MWTSRGVCTTLSEWTSVWCRWRPEWLCVSPSVWCWSSCPHMTGTPRIHPSRPECCGQRNTPERRSAASEERSYTWAGQTDRERETGELKLKHNLKMMLEIMSALKASLTLGLDSVTDSSSISCSLPREIHGWDSGVFGTIMSSSSSSSTSSSSSPCTGDYKHNLYKKKRKSQNYLSIHPSIAHL